jgi:hypothetical protein
MNDFDQQTSHNDGSQMSLYLASFELTTLEMYY